MTVSSKYALDTTRFKKAEEFLLGLMLTAARRTEPGARAESAEIRLLCASNSSVMTFSSATRPSSSPGTEKFLFADNCSLDEMASAGLSPRCASAEEIRPECERERARLRHRRTTQSFFLTIFPPLPNYHLKTSSFSLLGAAGSPSALFRWTLTKSDGKPRAVLT